MTKYLAIGGDAHSDVEAVKKSIEVVRKVKEKGDEVLGIYRGGDDGADPRFKDYGGLRLKPLAKVAKANGFTGNERYGEVLKIFKEGLKEDEKYSQYNIDINDYARKISSAFDELGIFTRFIRGNADQFQEYIRHICASSGFEDPNNSNHTKAINVLCDDFEGPHYDNVDSIFNTPQPKRGERNIECARSATLDLIPEGIVRDHMYRWNGDVAIITIPYSFNREVDKSMKDFFNISNTPERDYIEETLDERLEELNELNPSLVIQIQHEPPVQSLVTMLDPRNRPLEAGETYQKATDAITDMNPDNHLIFYGHVGNHHFAESVPHELKDRGIRTFHWPEEGHGGMLYLNLDNLEVREEKYVE